MNTFLKFNLFNNLEVSIKLYQLIPIQRMSTENFNLIVCDVNDKKLISNKSRQPEESNAITQLPNQVVNSTDNCVYSKSDHTTNLQVWSPYCNNFQYHSYYSPVYYCNSISQPYYSHFSYPFNFNNYLCSPYSRQYFHSGRDYRKNSVLNQKLEQIMSLRTWQKVVENPGTKPGFIFTLMSYNVLAQDLLEQHPYLYKHHDSLALTWPNRWNNLLNEISKIKPDILCLQEVQESHLADYYSILNALGYQSVFKKRTGYQSDGCAIYYKVDNISLVECNIVEYFQPLVPLLNRDNVGIVMKFVPKLHHTREFVVATTHLLYNRRRDDVRMAQMQLLLADIEKMSYKNDGETSRYLPVIITGDLNSPPCSDLYQFITKGSISYENLSPKLLETSQDSNKQILVTSHLGISENSQHNKVIEKRKDASCLIPKDEIKNPKRLTEPKNACTDSKKLTHNFFFKSVYDHTVKEINEATTFQDEWLTVDYIFYSKKKGEMYPKDKLKLMSKYRLPTSKELNGITIPNKILGSDHLSLIAKFKLEF